MMRDVRSSLRWLRSNPLFTASITTILAVGIGANTAIFTIVDKVLLQRMPYASSGRLVAVEETSNRIPIAGIPMPDYLRLRARSDLFADINAFQKDVVTITGIDEPVQAVALRTAGGLFHMLGSRAQLGRSLLPADDDPAAPGIAVLSDHFWRRAFHADPAVIGRRLVISDQAVGVVGVMPPGFEFPSAEYDLWLQLRVTPVSGLVHAAALMNNGLSVTRVQSALSIMARQLEREDPQKKAGLNLQVREWTETPEREYRLTLFFVLAAVALVLLIACANVAALLLNRAVQRQREMAIRASLGASDWRLLRETFIESLTLAALGSAAGLLVAQGTLQLLIDHLPAAVMLPHLRTVSLDSRALLFTIVLCFVAAALFSVAPALFGLKTDVQLALRNAQRSRSSARLFSVIMASETAFAFLLLTASGLMLRSLIRLQQSDHGFHADHVLTLHVPLGTRTSPTPNKYGTKRRQMDFYRDVLRRIERAPGVTSAAVVNNLPLSGFNTQTTLPGPLGRPALLFTRTISPHYFQVMGIGVVRGRIFSDADTMDAPRVAIINESLARQLFPDRDPIGRPMPSESPQAPVTTVVGVVRDAAQSTLQEPAKGELYLPYSQYIFGAFLSTVVVRTSVDPVKLGGVLRQEVWAVDRNQPVTKIETMDDVIADSIWRPRFSAWLLSVLGALALALTAAGAYAVVAYTTAMRTRDAAIRVALGASPQRILAETIRFAVVPVLCGIVMSAVLAVAVMRVLSSLMYETGTSDPVTYGAASGILVLTSVGASLWPAIRTARADASAMLRAD